MTKDVWFISDHHLSHAKLLQFKDKRECLIRPEFDNVEDMNNYILEAHNSVVKPQDDVYFLGDVMWNKPHAWTTLYKMQGNVRLTPGNHDNILELASNAGGKRFFRDIRLWFKFEVEGKKLLASHTPLNSLDIIRCDVNVHGHIHEKDMHDPRYFNVCVEPLGYEPIHIEDLVALI